MSGLTTSPSQPLPRLQAERTESGETEESETEYSQIYTEQPGYPVKWR